MTALSQGTAINVWLAGFSGAAVIQGLFPKRFSETTAWGHNPGWQREIAVWNIGMIVAASLTKRSDPERALLLGFAVLAAMLGTNHLNAAVRSPSAVGNWMGVTANAAGLAAAVAGLTSAEPD